MLRNKRISKVLSLLITMTMVLGCFTSFVYAEDNQISSAKVDLKEEALNKIMPEVKEDLENEDIVEILVYMKDQIDTKMIAQATRNAVSSSLTPYNTKLAVRRGVVEVLRDKAELTQVNILNYLKQEKENGNVLEFKSFHIVNMLYVKATKEIVENISFMPEVEKIYKNKTHQMEKVIITDEDNELNTDDVEWNIERVNADQAWELGFDGTGAVVGSLDTGVDWTHPALKNKWRGYNSETEEINPEGNWFDPVYDEQLPEDSDEHGTHVIGTMVGQEPDGSNKIGVAPGAKWISARVFNTSGSTTDRLLLDAAEWMLHPGGNPDNAPDVVNNSWGGLDGIDDWYRDAVNNWRAAEIFPVFSAGNQRSGEPAPWPGSISCPANYPESFAVAATDINNKRGSFSKLGPSPYDETLIKPEISAPGVSIKSSVPGGGYQGGWSGTSMSAPAVSGTVALMVSAKSSLTVEKIESIIDDTAIPLSDSTYPESPNFGYGFGLIDAFEAVSSVVSGTGIISGKVLVEGEDLERPVIEHEQYIRNTYLGLDTEIVANIRDDISIVKAELLVKQEGKPYWMLAPMNRILGDHKDGVYKGTIVREMLEGSLEESKTIYKIRARDYDGNVVVTDNYEINVKFGIEPDKYKTDFKSYPEGWTLEGDWEWGEPVEGVGPEPYIGTRLIGTVLDDKYKSESDSILIAPPIDLRDDTLESVTLKFHQWYEIEHYFDRGDIYISNTYGEDWIKFGPEYTGDAKKWHEIAINLDRYIGSPNPILVAFYFTSDVSGIRDGWYIDNVRLIETDEEAPSQPTGLIAETTFAGIKLSWNPSPESDLRNYTVYRSGISNGGEDGYVKIGDTSSKYFIDKNVEGGNTYYYVVTATDFSENESEYSEEVYAIAVETTIIFSTDFEEDNGGFITGVTESGYSNDWEWGIPTSGPEEAFTGTKLWATNLSEEYNDYGRGYIESPLIVIPEDITASLIFNHWIDAEQYDVSSPMQDYGKVQVSEDDGITWVDITGRIGGRKREWENLELNLNNYSGKTIKIRFFFFAGASETYDGWYIDNVLVAGVDTEDANKVSISKPVVDQEFKVEETAEHRASKRKYIKTKGPEYSFIKDQTYDYEIIHESLVEDIVTLQGIPADAVVTVLETGVSVRTNPATGRFFMNHTASKEGEEWTLEAEAYGYYPKTKKVSLGEGETVQQNLVLDPIPQGRIVGQVFDRYYKRPASNAVIRIKEDPRITPVVADEGGNFVIDNVYEGEYTLIAIAEGFEMGEVKAKVMGNETTEVQVPLKKLVGYDKEIAYDDGTAENGWVLNEAGNGSGVRFTPTEYAKVKGTRVFFWGENWPMPGGNEVSVAIYDEEQNVVAVSQIININRGEWNYIDLSSMEYSTDKDYYIVIIQPYEGDFCPGVGLDESSSVSSRSWGLIEGEFIKMPDDYGNLMIRAIMEYSVDTPQITNLKEINYTNQDNIFIEGETLIDGKVNIYVNGKIVGEVQSENNLFYAEINLNEEQNIIMVTFEVNEVETEPSKPIKVIKDKEAPVLVVKEPVDNAKINSESVHVIGNATDNIELVVFVK